MFGNIEDFGYLCTRKTNWFIPHITTVKPVCTGRLRHVRVMLKPSPKGHLTLTFFKPIPHTFLYFKSLYRFG